MGEVVVRRSAQAISTEDMPSVEYEDVEAGRGALATSFTFKEGKSGIRFEPGDVLYGKLRPYLGNRLEPDFRGVAVGDWWVLAPLSVTSSFLFSLIQSPRFVTVANQSSGSKMPRADWKLVGSAAFGIPSLPEQHCIGEFFSTLDSLIAAAERQEVLLRQKKQAYLQLMFPQEGENEPRLRFAGFSRKWEQRQLEELVSNGIIALKRGDVIPRQTGRYPVYSSSAAKDGLFCTSDSFMFDQELVTWSIDGGGKPFYRPRHRFSVTNVCGYALIRNPQTFTYRFLGLAMDRAWTRAHFDYSSKAHPSVIEKMYILLIPSLPEQHRIGAFFSTLDSLIAYAEKRTASLRALKSAYLQRMFV